MADVEEELDVDVEAAAAPTACLLSMCAACCTIATA